MKIYINKYKYNWISPYTVKEKFFFWKKDYDAHAKQPPAWLQSACEGWMKVADVFNRKINYVKIDYWDTWNMDTTLSPIILPMLKQLKATKHGSPMVDDEDVPEELRVSKKKTKKKSSSPLKHEIHSVYDPDYDDSPIHRKWDWVMDEMIWTFEQLCDDNSDDQFYDHTESNKEPDFSKSIALLKVDREGLQKHHDRIDNGLRLFGKYYRALWD